MLDFTELSTDGTSFELLIREILFGLGYHVTWSGVGPDGGRDLIYVETTNSIFGSASRRWLLQCKHFAHSARAVGVNDIDSISDSCAQHRCSAYALVSSTTLSSSLIDRLESLDTPALRTGYLDSVQIERLLSTPATWAIAQRFMPISAGRRSWHVSSTTEPNSYVANYNGYHFNLSNRIGSSARMHFSSIERRIEDIESIKLVDNHFIRIRAIWYNDKAGEYIYYLDYMHPYGEDTEYTSEDISKSLGDGWALDDGQIYGFDVRKVSYHVASDHYDPDHYDYYVPYLGSFLLGRPRIRSGEDWSSDWGLEQKRVVKKDGTVLSAGRDGAFERLVKVFGTVPGLKILRSVNSSIDYLSELAASDNMIKTIEKFKISPDNLFSALIVFESSKFSTIERTLSAFPQLVDRHISLNRLEIFLPGENDRAIYDESGPYFLEIAVHTHSHETPASVREALNSYFLEAATNLEKLLAR